MNNDLKILTPHLAMSHYGEERELDCTDGEIAIFEHLCKLYPGKNIRLVRVSKDYVTAKYRAFDLARFKWTDRAKWIMFPTYEFKAKRNYITSVSDIDAYKNILDASIENVENSK